MCPIGNPINRGENTPVVATEVSRLGLEIPMQVVGKGEGAEAWQQGQKRTRKAWETPHLFNNINLQVPRTNIQHYKHN